MSAPSVSGVARPSFGTALRFWFKLGWISFGGPTGQIAIMHTEVVERRRWIDERRFMHALNYCMLLPGPEAQQLATYIGWLLHGTRGGIAAGALFVLPSILILLVLSWLYVVYGRVPVAGAALLGLKAAVVAIVAAAALRIGRRALRERAHWALAAAAFAALTLGVPFPFIIAAAALVGMLARDRLTARSEPADDALEEPRVGIARTLRVALVCLTLWWLPVLLLALWRGADSTFVREALFFSKAAVLTFGGAYAVLGYVAQQAVDVYQWLGAAQMVDGLGLAETTPGPLIMVVQFVGFVGGWNQPDGLPPLAAAVLGALVTTWVTFLPCFLWIFAGAPYVERLRRNVGLTAALSAITAAVVGVILHLAVWFATQVYVPAGDGISWFAVALSAVLFVGLWKRSWNIVAVVVGSALAGVLYAWLTRAWSGV